jgi:hypothetical protein
MQCEPQLKVGTRLQPWTPRDEFDPEIFNRRRRTREQPIEQHIGGAAGEAR